MHSIDEIEGRINLEVKEISEVIGVTEDEAILILRYFRWLKD